MDQAIAETEKFLFDEYDGDKDGLMTRKEFFQVRLAALDRAASGGAVPSRRAHIAAHSPDTSLPCARTSVPLGAQGRSVAQAERGPDDQLLERRGREQERLDHL